jgi:hypothetical protein
MYRFLEFKPVWDADAEEWIYPDTDPIGAPLGSTPTSRPNTPRYLDKDDNRTPDLIFTATPDDDYLIGAAAGMRYPTGSKLTYVCFRYSSQDPNCWKIQLTIEYTDAVLGATTSIVYPWGLYAYNFNPEDVRKYVFQYQF